MKRSLYLLASVLVVFVLTLALVSCGPDEECKHDYSGDEYTITAEGHVYTCTKGCGATRTESHHYGSPVTVTPSTCTEVGVGEETCIICENKRQVPLAIAPHTYEKEYTSDETHHWRKCENCEAKIGVIEHKFVNRGRDNENHWMTCECGTKGEIEAHIWRKDPHPDGTMTLTCTVPSCNQIITNVPDSDHQHTWIDGDVTLAPTCTATGAQEQHCLCGAVGEKTLDMIAHDFTSGEYGKNDTHHWQKCSCGAEASEADRVPHDFGTKYETEGNYKVYTCECGQQKKEPTEGYIDPEGWT